MKTNRGLLFKKMLAVMTVAAIMAAVGLLGLLPAFAQEATRSFNPATVAPGGQVTVTIAAAGYGQAGGVTETLPRGFAYVSSNLSDSQVTELGNNQVRFTLLGDDLLHLRGHRLQHGGLPQLLRHPERLREEQLRRRRQFHGNGSISR